MLKSAPIKILVFSFSRFLVFKNVLLLISVFLLGCQITAIWLLPGYGLSTSVVKGKIYAIGGFLNLTSATSTVEEYDPTTDTWTKKADMPTARGYLSTSVVNGEIYAIGGTGGPHPPLSTVEAYDAGTDTWTKKADMLTARCGLSSSIVNGYIYVIGGAPNMLAPQFPMPASSIVEAYYTGFRAVEAEGKRPTTWGRMKGE